MSGRSPSPEPSIEEQLFAHVPYGTTKKKKRQTTSPGSGHVDSSLQTSHLEAFQSDLATATQAAETMAKGKKAAGGEEMSFPGPVATSSSPTATSNGNLPPFSPNQKATLPQDAPHLIMPDHSLESPSAQVVGAQQPGSGAASHSQSEDEDPEPPRASRRLLVRGRRNPSPDSEYKPEEEEEEEERRDNGRLRGRGGHHHSRSRSPRPDSERSSRRRLRSPSIEFGSSLTRGATSATAANRVAGFRGQPQSSQRIASTLPQTHPGSALHRKWEPVFAHTAKCDKCLKRNSGREILQRCDCTMQFCRECLDATIGIDGQHLAPVGGFNWTPKPAAPPATRRPRTRREPAPAPAANNSGNGRGTVNSGSNLQEAEPASRVPRGAPRTNSRAYINTSVVSAPRSNQGIEEDTEMTGYHSQYSHDNHASRNNEPIYDQGSDTGYDPMTLEDAQRIARPGPSRGSRGSEVSFGASRSTVPGYASRGGERNIEPRGRNLGASYSQGASFNACISRDGAGSRGQADRGLVSSGYNVPNLGSVQTFGDGIALLARLRAVNANNHRVREADFQYLRIESWQNDTLLDRIRNEQGEEAANSLFQAVTVMMRILLGFFGTEGQRL